MTGLAEDIAKVMTKAVAEIKKLSDEELKAFLAGEGKLRYVSPQHEVKLKSLPKPAPVLPVPSLEVQRRLNTVVSEDEATTYLTGLHFKLAELKALAAELEVRLAGTTAKAIVGDIVKVKVAGRLATEAVRRF